MSDPLSLYANEDDDIENYLPDPSESQNEGGQHDDVEHKESLSENEETAQQKQLEEAVNDKESAERPSSVQSGGSFESDLMAQIEEEIGDGPKDLDVTVENPEKIVKTMESYVAFSVKTKTTRSDFENPEYNVKRRYNDFLWLRQRLDEKYSSIIIPPLPEKHSLTIDRFDREFLVFRQAALHRFLGRLSQHSITSRDDILKAFLTLEYNEFQAYKKKGAGLFSRVTKSLTTMTGSMMLKNRSEHHTKIAEYAQSLGERMGAIDRVTSRLAGEQNEYALALGGYVSAYEYWKEHEEQDPESMEAMKIVMGSLCDDFKEMMDHNMLSVQLPVKEYALYSDVIKNTLSKRDAVQHEVEVLAEETIKCSDEKEMLEQGQTGGGFLGRSSSAEAVQLKKEKLAQRIQELDNAHQHNKEKLEKLNKQLDEDLERWHTTKKSDMKELIGGMADRNVVMYDKHIKALEGALEILKRTLSHDSQLLS